MHKINICVCTYKRPQLLNKCLSSLSEINLPENADVFVTIIDNDLEESARPIVENKSPSFPVQLNYKHEKQRGIPFARNRAIFETERLGGDYLVFIDDDEWAESEWLVKLYDYCRQYGGEIVVSGVVVSDIPEKTPTHISGLFNKKQRSTGTNLTSCATNNVLVPMILIRKFDLKFDESNPLAGGTDTIFFVQACSRGVVIKKMAEAIVHETIPENRLSIRWMAKRKYRAGITASWRKQQARRSRIGIVGSCLVQMIFDGFKFICFSLLGKKTKRNSYCLRFCKSAGIISGVVGRRVASYKMIDGK